MSLAHVIAAFDQRHRWLRDPDEAAGACVWASAQFARRVPGARCLHLWGCRRRFIHRLDEYPAIDIGYYHAVAQVGGLVVDWTRRQLEPKAAHPFIQTMAELRRDWLRIGRSEAILDEPRYWPERVSGCFVAISTEA